jgi:hypothetical protein
VEQGFGPCSREKRPFQVEEAAIDAPVNSAPYAARKGLKNDGWRVDRGSRSTLVNSSDIAMIFHHRATVSAALGGSGTASKPVQSTIAVNYITMII